MKTPVRPINNENGFALVVAMMIMVILTMLGIFATKTSIVELNISGNDKAAKESFYRADGGVEAGIELVEQDLSCPVGFKAPGAVNNNDATSFLSIGGVDIFDRKFAFDEKEADVPGATATTRITDQDFPSDTIRSIRIPSDPASRNDAAPHTNIAAYSVARYAEGSAIEMAAGHEGKGHSAAVGGGIRAVEIVSAHIGNRNALAKIHLQWKHLIGQEGDCIY